MSISAMLPGASQYASPLNMLQRGQAPSNQLLAPAANHLLGSERAEGDREPQDAELRKTFDQFIGEAFYGQMLSAMRSTVGKPAYFHGGRAEEIFQSQLDQTMAETITAAGVEQFTEPMYRLFTLSRT